VLTEIGTSPKSLKRMALLLCLHSLFLPNLVNSIATSALVFSGKWGKCHLLSSLNAVPYPDELAVNAFSTFRQSSGLILLK